MKKTLLAIILLLSFSLPSSADFKDVMTSVRALQDVEADNICTTTSINSDKQYWLTAAHCVADQTFIDGYPTTKVMVDTATDLAVLQTNMPHGVRSLKLHLQPPAVGDEIFVVGHPVGLADVQVFRGHISSTSTAVDGKGRKMTFDMTACGGNSGSSVVNSKDEVVSVLQIGFGRPCSGFSGGALWSDLIRVVRGYFKS